MKKLILFICLAAISACKQEPQETENDESMAGEQKMAQAHYPEALNKILSAHGGMDMWNKKKTLSFTIRKPEGNENHTIDLTSRMDKTVTPDYEMGNDGTNVWMLDKGGEYSSNPYYMHDLIFYFYAMPFVLADPGAYYSEADSLVIENKAIPGIKVTFDEGVGASPKDEYYLYYDAKTYHMVWLGYKAMFGSNDLPGQPNYISYDQWVNVAGINLPSSIAWHAVENGEVMGEKNRVDFNTIDLSERSKPEGFYAMPEGAKVVKKDNSGT